VDAPPSHRVLYNLAVIDLGVNVSDDVFQPMPMTDIEESSDISRSSVCTCESCLKARYSLLIRDVKIVFFLENRLSFAENRFFSIIVS